MFEWKPTEVEPSGTYFANNDFGLTGGEFVMLNFGLVDEPADYSVCRTNPAADPRCAAAFPRAEDNNAKDQGQYGLAMRYFASELNDTEFGLYYLSSVCTTCVITAVCPTSPVLP